MKYNIMKKLLFLLLFFIPLLLQGQRTWETDTLITNTDTTIFLRFYSYGDWAIQFDYSSYDQDDWTISLGNSQDGTSFDKLDDARLPYTLNVTSNSYTDETGATRSTVTFEGDAWRTIYMGIKIGTTGAGTDTLALKYTRE